MEHTTAAYDIDQQHETHINVVRNSYKNTRTSNQPPAQRYKTPYNKITNNRQQNMPPQTPRRDKVFDTKKKEVCQACGQYEHNHTTCYLTPKILHVLEWAKTNKEKIQPLLRKHKSMNSLEGRRAVVRHIMDMENVDEIYEDEILESGAYDDQIESMVNKLSHFNQES